MNYVLQAETGHLNFSPVGFRYVAKDHMQAFRDYNPSKFSLLKYFLCCRAIELTIKSMLLEIWQQKHVKFDFGHDLVAAYNALPDEKRKLSTDEYKVMEKANPLYMDKAFEYIQPVHAANGYSEFPDLVQLASLAERLIAIAEE